MATGTSRSWFLIPAAAVLTVVLGVWMVRQGPQTSRDHAGRHDVTVVLEAPEGDGEQAARALAERVVRMGVDGRVLEADARTVRLALRRVAEPRELVAALLTPEPLTFHLIPEPQRPLRPADSAPDPQSPVPWTLGEGRAATRAQADPAALEEGEGFALECIPPRKKEPTTPCALWRVGPAWPLSREDLAEVQLGSDRRTEEPLVEFTFTEEAAARFAALAEAADGQMVAIVALGELAARPRITKGDGGAKWSFSTRTGDTARPTAIDRAQRISTAARLSPLPRLRLVQLLDAEAIDGQQTFLMSPPSSSR